MPLRRPSVVSSKHRVHIRRDAGHRSSVTPAGVTQPTGRTREIRAPGCRELKCGAEASAPPATVKDSTCATHVRPSRPCTRPSSSAARPAAQHLPAPAGAGRLRHPCGPHRPQRDPRPDEPEQASGAADPRAEVQGTRRRGDPHDRAGSGQRDQLPHAHEHVRHPGEVVRPEAGHEVLAGRQVVAEQLGLPGRQDARFGRGLERPGRVALPPELMNLRTLALVVESFTRWRRGSAAGRPG